MQYNAYIDMLKVYKKKYFYMTLMNDAVYQSLQIRKDGTLLHSNSELGAHVRSNLCHFICFGHLIRLRAVTNLKSTIFLHTCARYSELPSRS